MIDKVVAAAYIAFLAAILAAILGWNWYEFHIDRLSEQACTDRRGIAVHQRIGPVVCIRPDGVLR